MSVLIKSMEMPTSCLSCDFCNPFTDTPYCRRLMKITPISTRLDDCPLVPVPPHGRLIDADAMKEAFSKVWKDNQFYSTITAEVVDNTPAIIEAEGEE